MFLSVCVLLLSGYFAPCMQSKTSKCFIMIRVNWRMFAAWGKEYCSRRKIQSWKAAFVILPHMGEAFYKDLISLHSQLQL